jgi:uncharacterized protein
MSLVKVLCIVLGTISLCIGIIGILMPGLPTTPFVLLTAGLYVRSSDKLYQKLISNRFIGSYIFEFRTNKGMTRKKKVLAMGIMWGMILLSVIFFIPLLTVKLIILILGLIGTLVMGFIVSTIHISNKNK